MALIDPFAIEPTEAIDRLIAYFYCTWFRVNYEHEGVDAHRAVIYELMGTNAGNVSVNTDVLPRSEVVIISGVGSIVHFRGTTATLELINEILFSQLRNSPDHEGLVNNYFLSRYLDLKAFVQNNRVVPWVACGHSLGGALGGLMSVLGADRVISAGAPREGNRTYAFSRDQDIYLRLTNDNDPVPKVPLFYGIPDWPLTELALAAQLIDGLTSQNFYKHWGTRLNFFVDGSTNRPAEQDWQSEELAAYLVQAVREFDVIEQHFPREYCRRIRAGIPAPFPAPDGLEGDFPGLEELDQLNLAMNALEGITWEIATVPLEVALLRQFLNATAMPDPPEAPFHAGPGFQFRCQ